MLILNILQLCSISSLLLLTSCVQSGNSCPSEQNPFYAAEDGDFELLKLLLRQKPSLIKATNEVGATLLHSAAYGNQPEIIRYLVKEGADLEARDRGEDTPLFYAAQTGNSFEAAKVLIELGADVNARREWSLEVPIEPPDENVMKEHGPSVLELAATSGDYRLVELLIKKGAKIDSRSLLGSALHYACFRNRYSNDPKDPETAGNRKVIELLTPHIDINCSNQFGETPLGIAAEKGAVETVKYLISNHKKLGLYLTPFILWGALYDAVDPDGLGGPAKDRAEVIKILIEAGADDNLRNPKTRTPRQLAEKLGNKTIINAFKTASPPQKPTESPSNWTAELQWTLKHDRGVGAICFSPDGKRLLTSTGRTFRLWDVPTGRELEKTVWNKSSDFVRAIAWSPDGRYALLGAGQHSVRQYKGTQRLTLWDVKNWKEVRQLEGHQSPITRVAFSPDGRRVVAGTFDDAGTFDGDVYAWDVQTGRQISHYQPKVGHTASESEADTETYSLDVSPNGKFALWAGGSHNYQLRLFDIDTGRELKSFKPCGLYFGHVTDAVFTRDGSRILAAHSHGYIRIWNIEQVTSSPALRISATVIRSVAFSQDDRLALVGSYTGELTLWQIEDVQQKIPNVKRLLSLQAPHDESKRTNALSQVTAGISRVALSPDSRFAAAADSDGTVRIWKIRKKESMDE